MNVKPYLAAHVSQNLPPVMIHTGHTFYGGLPYERTYHAEVIDWDESESRLTVWLTFRDYAPNGANTSTSEPSPNGEYTLRLLDTDGLMAVWRAIVLVADPPMIDYIAALRPA